MKKLVIALVALTFVSCGTDNSSTVKVQVDGNGCFIAASNFDSRSESPTNVAGGEGTVVYVWDCAEYVSLVDSREYQQKRVSLIFLSGTCLQFQAELVEEGLCFDGKVPVVQ